MPYSYATLAQAVQQLSARLYDPTNQQWATAELQSYIIEALRTWNAMANFWRGDFPFTPQASVWWYDLTDTTNLPGTLRPLTVTDQQIYSLIEYHLLEPQTTTYPLTWTGSAQFSINDLMNAVQRRRDEILSTTGCTLTRRLVTAAPGVLPPRTYLPDTVLDVRRVAWIPVAGFGFTNAVLWQSDVWGMQSYSSRYPTLAPGTPKVFCQSSEPPLSFDTERAPAVPGQYEVLTIESGGDLSTASTSSVVVPDDWTWVLKWGALADLLGRESNAKDAYRSAYCEQRYRQGLALMMSTPSVLALKMDGLPLQVDPVRSADSYKSNWQALPNGTPSVAVMAGLNLLGLSPAPDSNPHGLVATVVENAPTPVTAGDPIQLGRDDYDALIDYAQHLASFKMGFAELAATFPLLQRFIQQAQLYNSRLGEQGQFMPSMYRLAQQQLSDTTGDSRYSPEKNVQAIVSGGVGGAGGAGGGGQ